MSSKRDGGMLRETVGRVKLLLGEIARMGSDVGINSKPANIVGLIRLMVTDSDLRSRVNDASFSGIG